jgi:hypothetical protein
MYRIVFFIFFCGKEKRKKSEKYKKWREYCTHWKGK